MFLHFGEVECRYSEFRNQSSAVKDGTWVSEVEHMEDFPGVMALKDFKYESID